MSTHTPRETFTGEHKDCVSTIDEVGRPSAQAEAESFALDSTERLWALVTFKDGPHQNSGLTDYTIRCTWRGPMLLARSIVPPAVCALQTVPVRIDGVGQPVQIASLLAGKQSTNDICAASQPLQGFVVLARLFDLNISLQKSSAVLVLQCSSGFATNAHPPPAPGCARPAVPYILHHSHTE